MPPLLAFCLLRVGKIFLGATAATLPFALLSHTVHSQPKATKPQPMAISSSASSPGALLDNDVRTVRMYHSPDDPLIPFQVQVTNLGDSALTSLAETSDGLTWSIQDGAPVSLTAVEAVHDLPDLPLLALCIAFGIYAPLDAIRRDPAGLLGELAKMLATPEIIPECLRGPARRRA